MISTTFKLKGLTCHACVKVIYLKISEGLGGIKDVRVSDDKSQLAVISEREVGLDEIKGVLKDTPYEVYA